MGTIAPPPPAISTEVERAFTRKMTVIAQDPGLTRGKKKNILMATITVVAENLKAGPIGHRVQIVDYDSAQQQFLGSHVLPEELTKEPRAWKNGNRSILKDFAFHAQNTYALVMKTLARFEYALGRRIPWSFDTHQLKVAPHGMAEANAFYDPSIEGLVFGYFEGASGERVQTCLSHDIVVHETTHALLDAMRERYMDASSPDQAAFHEGFSDVIALLSVFSQPEIVRYLLLGGRDSGPKDKFISRKQMGFDSLLKNSLFALAEQMGSELDGIRGKPLRQSAVIQPSPKLKDTAEYLEPHRRGELFVAAVMRGFVKIWSDRVLTSGDENATRFPLSRVAEEGSDIAERLATMWIRAIDYMPPVHLVFGDALSAALTADYEVRPDDSRYKLRDHMMKSFAEFGFVPSTTRADGTGLWEEAPPGLKYDRVRCESMKSDEDEVFKFIWENRDTLNLCDEAYTQVLNVRPVVRIGIDGFVLRETVAQYYQVVRYTRDELLRARVKVPAGYLRDLEKLEKGEGSSSSIADAQAMPRGDAAPTKEVTTALYGGGVLIFDEYGHVKYWIRNNLLGRKQEARLEYMCQQGTLRPSSPPVRGTAARISALHRLRALDAHGSSRNDRW